MLANDILYLIRNGLMQTKDHYKSSYWIVTNMMTELSIQKHGILEKNEKCRIELNFLWNLNL